MFPMEVSATYEELIAEAEAQAKQYLEAAQKQSQAILDEAR